MRRMLGLGFVLLMLAAPFLASAQTIFPTVGPGGVLVYSSASETCVNTTAECSMFQYNVPAGYTATASTVGALVSQWFHGDTPDGRDTPVLWGVPQPLHLRMLGSFAAAAAANVNVGINFGGSTATVSMTPTVDAGSSGGSIRPVRLDVWVVPVASSTATPNAVNTLWLAARLEYANVFGQIATASNVVSTQTLAPANLASPNMLNVYWRWGAASNGNSVIFHNRLLKLGE